MEESQSTGATGEEVMEPEAAIEHTYGSNDDCSSEDDSSSTYRKCKCGSADH